MQNRDSAPSPFDLIDGLRVPSLSLYRDQDGNTLESLRPLSRVNIFVGENNSGKSLLLRYIARQKAYDVDLKFSKDANKNLERKY